MSVQHQVYSTILRGCGCLHDQRSLYLERANQVLDFCINKRLLDDVDGRKSIGNSNNSNNRGNGSNASKSGSSLLRRQYQLRLNIVTAKVALAVEDLRKAKRPLLEAGMLLDQSSKNELVGAAASEDWNDRTSDFNFSLQMLRANQE